MPTARFLTDLPVALTEIPKLLCFEVVEHWVPGPRSPAGEAVESSARDLVLVVGGEDSKNAARDEALFGLSFPMRDGLTHPRLR